MTASIPFVPGRELAHALYDEGVQPIMARRYSRLRYGAGRLDAGSEVLGFDTRRSMDHDWGPRLTLYVAEADFSEALAAELRAALADELPFAVRGVPTHFGTVGGGSVITPTSTRPINHGVSVTTLRQATRGWLGVDLGSAGDDPPSAAEWLTMPTQLLRAFTTGPVFRDDTGELGRARQTLAWYPRDLWLYLLAAQWLRIDQEEPFMGRCGEVGDDLGSRVLAARLVREVMQLAFLMERQYAPYSKWFGSAFAQLTCASTLTPYLESALAGDTWQERERSLSRAYEAASERHNALGLTPPIMPRVSSFYDRPYQVIHGSRFWQALRNQIQDEALRRLAADQHAIIGSTSQWADSTDVLAGRWVAPLRALYRGALDGSALADATP